MNTAAHLALLRQPWLAGRGRSGAWWMLALMLILAGLVVGQGLWSRVGVGALLATLALWLWWMQVDGLLAQNRPELARLLPGQPAALRRSLLLQAVVIGAVALIGLVLAGAPLGPAMWWVVAGLLLSAWLAREPLLWVPVSLWPVIPLSGRALAMQAAALPLPLQGLWLLAAAGLLLAVIGTGGAWHRALDGRRRRWQESARRGTQGRGVPVSARWPWLRRITQPFLWPDQVYRRWLLAHASPLNSLQRLELGLQQGSTWPTQLWLMLLVFGGFGLGLAAAAWQWPGFAWREVLDNAHIGLSLGMFSALGGAQIARASALWSRRQEQALLVLLPGPPTGPGLTLALDRLWRREGLALWACGTLLVIGILACGGASRLPFIAAFAAACLPLGAWAQKRQRHWRAAPNPMLLWLAGPGLALIPASLAQAYGAAPALSLVAGLAAFALITCRPARPAKALLPVGRADSLTGAQP